MSRITEAVLGQVSFGRNANQPILDPTYGGQFGYAPNLTEWVSNQGYVARNAICILLEAPRFFQLMPDPNKWVSALKSILELHCRTIEGYNAGLKLEFDEHPVGGAGEMQQEVTDSKRDRTEPSFTFVEKYGNSIQLFLQNWIQYGIMDPDTKYALISTLSGQKPEDLLADWYTCSVLVMEPDPTHQKVIKAWVTANMMPMTTDTIEAKRDLASARELKTLTVGFTGVSQTGLGVINFAQSILDSINMSNANPYLRPSFVNKVDEEISSTQEGYVNGVEKLGNTAVPGIN